MKHLVTQTTIKHMLHQRHWFTFIHLHISNFFRHLFSHTQCFVWCIAIMYHEMLMRDTHPRGTYVNSRWTSVVSSCMCCIISWAKLCSSHLLIGCEPPCCLDCCCTERSMQHKREQLYYRERTVSHVMCGCDQSCLYAQTSGGWGEENSEPQWTLNISTGRQERSSSLFYCVTTTTSVSENKMRNKSRLRRYKES